ncbi:hypothetical protein D5E69_23120 (plasmid) [Rossellomorea marisflavi]|uniref:hypothetical protein n=1 Tax=Rossellomorea marisflavi TaxID=189381 RepID=UPI001317C539|nr:hypothetical protein [Rossellomorea marisflavi]QHA38726.1 hypothetical protein D5E69_23120 [Rossellomorea marisflavi]
MKKVLLAIGDERLSGIFRRALTSHSNDFEVLDSECFRSQYLEELIDTNRPDILLLHESLLFAEYPEEERDDTWLRIIQRYRVKFEDTLRIVFVCERSKRDPFLSHLVIRSVYDIFNTSSIDKELMVEQLKERPLFTNIKQFIHGIEFDDIEVVEDELDDPVVKKPKSTEKDEGESKLKKEKNKVQKQVVQKVINKNIIKRDINIQLNSQVEKLVGIPIEKKIIMIASPFKRSGSTFIAHMLARQLANMGISVSFVESPYSYAYTYDRFIGHEKISNFRSKFYQFSSKDEFKLPGPNEWDLEGINMVSKHPSNEPIYSQDEIPFDMYVKVLLSLQSTVTIVDAGTDWNLEVHKNVHDIATKTYFVVEPDFSLMQYIEESKEEHILDYRALIEEKKTELIANRFEDSLKTNEVVEQVFQKNLKACVPVFPVTEVFDAQYKGLFLNDVPSVQPLVEEALRPIIEDILPEEFIKKQKGKISRFMGMFNKRLTINKNQKEMNPQ